ncbi:MAG: molybdopterin molybdotransferase MoeA [Candidatus Bathyarchaeia archaeon]
MRNIVMARAYRKVIKLIPYEDALKKIFSTLCNRASVHEIVPVDKACGRILAEDIYAHIDVPENNISLVDGFAVKCEDVVGASQEKPVRLRVIGKLYPWSDTSSAKISDGEAYYVACGAPIPSGANAVIKVENVVLCGEEIEVKMSATVWENICLRGEDIKRGDLILRKGALLRPQDIGVLAGLGIKRVKVLRKPRIAIISTGNELIEKSKRDPEAIPNNYALILAGLISKIGGEPMMYGIVPDDITEIREKICSALNESDIIMTIGGCSLGERDFVPEAVNLLGEPGVIFHGVMIKPGRVSAFGMIGGKPIVMLPGLFASTIAGFYLIFVPSISCYMGLSIDLLLPKVNAKICRDVPADKKPYHTFLPTSIKSSGEDLIAEPIMDGPASLIRFINANGFILLPPKRGLGKGERVNVTLFSSDELFRIMPA